MYKVDKAAKSVFFRALDSDYGTTFPLEPFHGTIGVAPAAYEVRNVLVPEMFGGNMDTPEAKAGATIYLGVNVPGALFSLGDGHYTMGEGEACGVAVEGAMNTVLTVEVVRGVFCEWLRLESDDSLMVAGSYRPLEEPTEPHTPRSSSGSPGTRVSRSWTPTSWYRSGPARASPMSATRIRPWSPRCQ